MEKEKKTPEEAIFERGIHEFLVKSFTDAGYDAEIITSKEWNDLWNFGCYDGDDAVSFVRIFLPDRPVWTDVKITGSEICCGRRPITGIQHPNFQDVVIAWIKESADGL